MSVTLVLAALFSWAMDPAPGPTVPFWWTAYPEADNSILVNPAGTGWLNGSDMRIGAVLSDSSFEHFDRFTLENESGGFSGWWEDNQSLRRFTASGSHQMGALSLGLGYTWYDPTVGGHPQEGERFFTFGMNLRSDEHIGFGATARTATGDIDACYIAGVALRPTGTHTVTLTGDYRFQSGIIDSRWTAGAEVRAIDGLTFRGAYGENDTFTAGLQVDFGKVGISAGAETHDGDYTGGTAEIILYDRARPSIVSPLPDFLSYSVGDTDELPSRAFLGPVNHSFTRNITTLARGVSDPSVEGVLIDMSGYDLNAAQGEELREIMVRYRERGKPVFAYMEYADKGSYYTASAAEAICIHKAGQVSVGGYTGYAFFVRGLLDKLGLFPDLMHIGDYKSASDMLTEYEISEAQIEATRALLESFKEEQVRGISEGRGLEPAQMSVLFSGSPFAGGSMVTMGLVDTTLYHDQFEEYAEDRLGRSLSTMSPEFYRGVAREPSRWGETPVVAVVVATGNIINGESGGGPMGRNMGSDTITELLQEAASAPGVKAIVLRIDSGGGDAMASADMHHAVENIREEMPVVVSMGAVAASGGYYMACGADAIFADRMTITGSIGIISGKIVFGDLLSMVGINVEKVEIDPAGSPGNPFEPYTDSEHERHFTAMREGYNLFVNTVAKGRNMTFDQVDAIGQGRVWSGADALELGLVDYNGGVVDAIAHAAMLAGMDTENPEIAIFPGVSGLGTLNLSPFGTGTLAETVAELAEDPLLNARGPLYLAPFISVE